MHKNSLNVFLQVIEEASRGSKFYAKKQADQAKVCHQVKDMKGSLASFTFYPDISAISVTFLQL